MPPSLFARRGRTSDAKASGCCAHGLPGRAAFPGDLLHVCRVCSRGGGHGRWSCDVETFARRRLAYSAVEDASRVARLVAKRLPQGCFKDHPSVDVTTGVHSRKTEALLRRGAATRFAWSAFVGSHHLDGLLHRGLVGLLHPTADPGVHRVSALGPTCPSWLRGFPSGASPSRAFPSSSSRSARRRVAMPPCRCVVRGRRRLRGLHPLGSPLRERAVADLLPPEALLGFPHLKRSRARRPAEAVGSARVTSRPCRAQGKPCADRCAMGRRHQDLARLTTPPEGWVSRLATKTNGGHPAVPGFHGAPRSPHFNHRSGCVPLVLSSLTATEAALSKIPESLPLPPGSGVVGGVGCLGGTQPSAEARCGVVTRPSRVSCQAHRVAPNAPATLLTWERASSVALRV
jgi:hypothetical protein